MFEITLDLTAFDRWAANLGGAANQVPFALSTLLNDAAFKARQVIVSSTWPGHVEVHNPNFISAALRIDRSTKHDLTVRIRDVLDRGHLRAHAEGGAKRAARRFLAVPVQGKVRRGVHGIVPSQRPSALIARTPKRALRITSRGIFVGEGGRLHLRYSFTPTARIPRDVPFHEDFEYTIRRACSTGFPDAMTRAMATAR